MIDLRLLREDPELIRASQRLRGESTDLVDALLSADEERRAATQRFESVRAEQKSIGKEVAKASGDERAALLARTKDLALEVKAAEAAAGEAEQALRRAHLAVPNVVEDGAPAGGEDDFVVLREVGAIPEIANPKDHLEIGEALRAIDTERGAKVSGSRFYFLTGVGALLQLGMLQLAIQQAVEHGFTPSITPTLVRPESMEGTGFLGSHASEIYRLEADDLYLVGTSEVALAAYHTNEIIDLSNGPERFAGWSTCYRREAGSHGKDVRGILRVHQFDKVEMFSFCRPEDALAEHQRLLAMEEEMLAKVEIPYRVIDVAAGDLGTSASRKYDCEAWVPSQGRYREVTSTSNCTTFQARRLNVRYRDENGKTQIAATLNGTLATTRWLIPILENHQQPDGSVRVPKALQPFLGGREVLEPAK
ncbi:putative seryl-tRNA synthetase [Actinoplanes missouriensis 431]|uniref:Serine--tRNA ligase n=1 Tax=Actinoplanes missouriensis (strain ATCC 14538 / DSM 43046 / CBS 188.64 / JCM 3121 / NBRC 102363 / NCIMB 12654 / NRRL B-3342 / UNCC 431) TaxID=512565 RepID=I0HJT5_ACTM4|nr:serine--tRNA ligase [Actinoplanes missouriensis]BAL93272.1 putative seryl-tRNA synthetase [Actinoplanes missouriensis 431]